MLGILADKELSEAVAVLNDGTVISNIKVISMEPEIVESEINPNSKSKYYIAIDNEQKVNREIKYYLMNSEERVNYWDRSLRNKIICFRPHLKWDTTETDKINKNIIIEFIEDIDYPISDDEYVPIPVVNLDNKNFENKLQHSEIIDLDDYNHSMYQPEYIICNNYIYFNFQGWDKNSRQSGYWICSREPEKIQKLKVDIDKIGHIMVDDNLIFMRRDILMEIENNKEAYEISKEILKTEDRNILNETSNKSEIKFLDDFKRETLISGLSYTIDDLVNLHICVKTNPLTILSGMSGIGKSKLANMYSRMLSCTETDETLLFLPINPSYTEPGDLLGYLNNTTGIYMPSNTRLVDFLKHAYNNMDKMHIVIFDEMNLSQVEYWFAPFISLLEQELVDRKLYLYNPQTNCINDQQYPSWIPITNNVRFIGTVNVDETTKDFSDRLLDRANIIILQKELFKTLKDEVTEFNKNNNEIKVNREYSYGEYKEFYGWINKESWINAYTDKEIQFFDELHEIINKYDAQKGVSFRIVKKIGEYLNNIPIDEEGRFLLEWSKAFDLQIKQRIITKIKGTEKQFGGLIGKINSFTREEPVNGELYRFFSREDWQNISDFKLTKQEIMRKAKELGVYGYAN